MSKFRKGEETPVIRIGKMGLSEGAIKEIKRQLKEHKIVKIKFLNTIVANKEEYNSQVEALLKQLNDAKVEKKIGHTIVLSQK
ncbi:MAG: YhbY family RNA-binding protein [Candidatus Odinarchaeota archaeon]|nr:YhbY family RNA-binding protein [Candidatus Odinarchaeota archaeon]